MQRLLVVEERPTLTTAFRRLTQTTPVDAVEQMSGSDVTSSRGSVRAYDAIVYRPRLRPHSGGPDLGEAAAVLTRLATARAGHVVVLSSAAVYAPTPFHHGFVRENVSPHTGRSNRFADTWSTLEILAHRHLLDPHPPTILRPAPLLDRGEDDYWNRLFRGVFSIVVAGYDPGLQLLAPPELAHAIVSVLVADRRGGVYNVGTRDVVPLRAALRLAGVRTVPVPVTVMRMARAVTHRLGLTPPAAQLDYLRYPSSVSSAAIAADAGVKDLTEL